MIYLDFSDLGLPTKLCDPEKCLPLLTGSSRVPTTFLPSP